MKIKLFENFDKDNKILDLFIDIFDEAISANIDDKGKWVDVYISYTEKQYENRILNFLAKNIELTMNSLTWKEIESSKDMNDLKEFIKRIEVFGYKFDRLRIISISCGILTTCFEFSRGNRR